jgi:hypothetical protein
MFCKAREKDIVKAARNQLTRLPDESPWKSAAVKTCRGSDRHKWEDIVQQENYECFVCADCGLEVVGKFDGPGKTNWNWQGKYPEITADLP